ncbi:hypothetical protein [Brevundimonas sp.]|uniref:hypothetical protein n=1 Tax=Brevundimonas sp. TaxID=1871086 RepID=UPI00286C2F94|nr:hypothetical protein [Brevundimonas sp.]
MTDPNNDTADIAWLRSLAEEGANTPPQGGAILFAAGLIWGTASIAHWFIITGLLPIDPAGYGLIWGAALLVFFVTLFVLLRRLKAQGGVETAANRAFGSVWSALGWGIFSLFTALMLLDVGRTGEVNMAEWSLAIPSIIMAFYGMGWAVSATMLRQRMLWYLAIGSFIAAPVLALISGSTAQYLAYAAALYVLMALPGYLLMRAAKRG